MAAGIEALCVERLMRFSGEQTEGREQHCGYQGRVGFRPGSCSVIEHLQHLWALGTTNEGVECEKNRIGVGEALLGLLF
jgi:hypothetical protein